MAKYIVKDMMSVLCYFPYGVIVGIVVAMILRAINDRRVKKNKASIRICAITSFVMYMVIILCITFLSREDGSSKGVNLELFSTWGINVRNDAYIVENILLFIPYGFVCAWAIPWLRRIWSCTLIGLITSLEIECLQLITGRGFFQIDDVLTNTIGAVIGYLMFRVIFRKK